MMVSPTPTRPSFQTTKGIPHQFLMFSWIMYPPVLLGEFQVSLLACIECFDHLIPMLIRCVSRIAVLWC